MSHNGWVILLKISSIYLYYENGSTLVNKVLLKAQWHRKCCITLCNILQYRNRMFFKKRRKDMLHVNSENRIAQLDCSPFFNIIPLSKLRKQWDACKNSVDNKLYFRA